MISGCPGVLHTRELSEGMKQFIFKLSALIVVEFGWISEPWDRLIENPICSHFACLLSGRICQCKQGEVIDHEDILIPTTVGFKEKKVNAEEFKGVSLM